MADFVRRERHGRLAWLAIGRRESRNAGGDDVVARFIDQRYSGLTNSSVRLGLRTALPLSAGSGPNA
jgi:hypothetical protein